MTVGKRLKPILIAKRGSTTIGAYPFIVGMVWRAGISLGIGENLLLGRIAPNAKMPADNGNCPMSEDELDWQSSCLRADPAYLSAGADQRADPTFGEDLQQQHVRYAAVQNDRCVNALADGTKAGLDLRDHTA